MPNADGHARQCVARAYVRAVEIDPSLTGEEAEEKVYNADGSAQKRRCRKFAIRGGTVCDTHGGSTTHVKRAAAKRLAYARDLALERIIDELESLDADIALKAATLAMKHAPAEADDELGGLRDALSEIRERLEGASD